MGHSFPYVTSNLNSAVTSLSNEERSILIIGAMVSGTASSGALVEDLKTEAEFNAAFGRTSQVAKAGRAAIQALSISRKRPKISAIGLTDNGSGVAATGTVAFSGTATAAGTITIYTDSIRNGKYELTVAVGDTAADLGAAFETAVGANADSPVTASDTTGTVTLTAVNKGTQGNTIGLKSDLGNTAGISVTLTAFASGATDPSLSSLFDPIADKRYSTIVYPYEWGVSTLSDETEARFNVDNKIQDGLGLVCETDTYANINTSADSYNQKTLAYIGNKIVDDADHRGGAIFESPIVIASYIAALRELRMTTGANVASITTNNQTIGGLFFGAIPYHNTPVTLLPVIETGDDFTDLEAAELESSGVWLLRNNPGNTAIISNEAVTTYKTNTSGQVDATYEYVNYLDTLSLIREYVFNRIKADLSQHILTTGSLIAGRPMINSEGFVALMMGYYDVLSGTNGNNNYVLLRAGESEKDAFKQAIEDSIVVTLPTGTITTESIANIVTQVRDIVVNFTPTFE